MKRKFVKITTAVFAAIIVAALSTFTACSVGADDVLVCEFFGAPVTITFTLSQSEGSRSRLVSEVERTLKDLEKDISATKVGSDVYNFNLSSGGEVKVKEQTYKLIETADVFYEATGGAVDITTANLSDLWGFSYRYAQKDYAPQTAFDREKVGNAFPLPEQKYVSAFLSLCDFSAIRTTTRGNDFLLEKTLSVSVDGVCYPQKIDLSAFAKGYGASVVRTLLEEYFVRGAFVSFGGSSLYLGDYDGGAWQVGIVDPNSVFRTSFAKISVQNAFVSTSGSYERYYEVDGKRYHHVIDPATGYPAESDVLSATVVGANGEETDAFSTACVVMGRAAAQKMLEEHGLIYVIVTTDNAVYTNADITILNEEYHLSEVDAEPSASDQGYPF